MSYLPAREWRCDYCDVSKVFQLGGDMLPTPPQGWFMVDVVRLEPAHSQETAQGKVKVGPARDTMRKVVCPGCSHVLDALYKVV